MRDFEIDRDEPLELHEQVAAEIRRAIVEFRRGRGITVTGSAERGAVVARARELVEYARLQGFRADEPARIIEDLG